MRIRLAALLVLALADCGKGGPAAPKGPDFSSPEAVWAQASKALEGGNLAGLGPFLSDAGAAQVSRDLSAWCVVLKDPGTGPRVLARIPPAKTEAEKADLEHALGGDLASLLRVYVRADPHPAAAPSANPRAADATFTELEYASHDGSRRRVVLVREGKDWKIAQLQL